MGKNQCAKRNVTFRLPELHATPKLAPIQKILVSICLDNCPYWECISKCKQGTKQIREIREFYIIGPYGSSATGEKLKIWRETVYFTGEYPPPCSGDSGSLLEVDIECLAILATLAFLMAGGQNIRPNSFFVSRKHWWLPDTTIVLDRRLKEQLPYIVLLDRDSERYGLYRNPHYHRQVKEKKTLEG